MDSPVAALAKGDEIPELVLQGFVKPAVSQVMDAQLLFRFAKVALMLVSLKSLLAELAPGFASHEGFAGLLAWLSFLCLLHRQYKLYELV